MKKMISEHQKQGSEIIKNEDIIVEETLMGRILRMNKKEKLSGNL